MARITLNILMIFDVFNIIPGQVHPSYLGMLTEGPFSCFWGECEVAHMDITIPNDDFAICHGASRFVKNDKIADLKRKGKTGHRFVMWFQGSWMVLMCFPSCVSHMRLIQVFICENIPQIQIMLFSSTHWPNVLLAKPSLQRFEPGRSSNSFGTMSCSKIASILAQHGFNEDWVFSESMFEILLLQSHVSPLNPVDNDGFNEWLYFSSTTHGLMTNWLMWEI